MKGESGMSLLLKRHHNSIVRSSKASSLASCVRRDQLSNLREQEKPKAEKREPGVSGDNTPATAAKTAGFMVGRY